MVRQDITLGNSETNQSIQLNRPLAEDVGSSTQAVSVALTGTSYTLNFAANLGAVVVNVRGGALGTRAAGLEDLRNDGVNVIPDASSGVITSSQAYVSVTEITADTAVPLVFGLQFGDNANHTVSTTVTYGAAVALPNEFMCIPS